MEKEKKIFKVEASTRFLFAPTGRIYDKGDVFSVKTEADFNYLTKEHPLCKAAKDDAEITETEQDRQDKLIAEAFEKEKEVKQEVAKVIEEKFTEKPSKKTRQKKTKA